MSVISRRRPRIDPRVLTGAAMLIDSPERIRSGIKGHADWQKRAWTFYDSGGELRYAATWVGNAMSKVRLLAAELPDSLGDPPTAIDAGPAFDAVQAFAGGVVGQSQILSTLAVHLSIPGLGFVVGEPPDGERVEWLWYAVSADEIRRPTGGAEESMEVQDEDGSWRLLDEEAIVVRVWRAHKRVRKEPDSPVRPLLDTLTEIEILGSVIRAQGTSRLAGAGVLWVPSEAEWQAEAVAESPDSGDPEGEQEETSFYQDLIRSMVVPLNDRSNPASVVPLLGKLPAELIDKIKHMRFDSALDEKVLQLRDSAIRRLSLGLEVPPEILLGMGDVNHWSAWEISESALSFHIEPLAEVICDALTEGFLRPYLASRGAADPSRFVVWYTTDDLRVRPDRSGAAKDLYDRAELSAEALRRESGFTEADAPTDAERLELILRNAITSAASLAPGILPILFPDVDWSPLIATLAPTGGSAPPPAEPEALPAGPPPRDEPTPPEDEELPSEDAVEASAARPALVADVIVAAADGLVVAALRTASSRYASALGKGRPGGPASVTCSGPLWECYPVPPSSLDALLAGAWERVPEIAARHHLHAEALAACLDNYCRSIIRAGLGHDYDRLTAALGR